MERSPVGLAMIAARGIMLLIVGLLCVPAVSAAAPEPAFGRDTVVIEAFQEPSSFNPLLNAPGLWSALAALFTIDVEVDHRTWRPFPQGVLSLPSMEAGTWTVGGRRMTLLWKVRPRKWHDGRRVTCADYVFTFKVASNPSVPVRSPEVTQRIASVSCPRGGDGLDVRVDWRDLYPYANLTVTGQRFLLPRHRLERFYRAAPARLGDAPYGHDTASMIGDGAYRLTEWTKGQTVVAEAVGNHDIFGTPRISRLVWRFNFDAQNLDNLRTGAVDVSLLTIDLLKAWATVPDPRYRIVLGPTLVWEHIDFNLDNPFLRDIRVRRAIAYGINRRQILQNVHLGHGEISHSFLSPRHPAYTSGVQTYAFDPARARALLKDAGFTPGADGIVHDVRGNPLTLEYVTTAGNRLRERTQEVVREQLRQIGIDIIIRRYPGRVLLREVLPRRRFTGLAEYAWVWSLTDDCTLVYTSDGVPAEHNGWTGQNYPGYVNPEIDRLCRASALELDETRRLANLRESSRILARDLPALPLFYIPGIWAVKQGLEGLVLSIPGGSDETWNVHQWFWR